MKKIINILFNRHTILITILVYLVMTVSSWIPLNFKVLNPFKKSLSDYDATDIVFSQFKDKNSVFDSRIVLVNIGRPDRVEIDSIINHIQSYKPKVIGIDIHFEELKEPKIDSSLRKTLMRYDNIILSKRLTDFDEKTQLFNSMEGCHPLFCDSLQYAFTNFYALPDMTIRQFSPMEKVNGKNYFGLGTALAIYKNDELRDKLISRDAVEYINYIGDQDAFINVNKSQILNHELNLEESFRDKIVLLGYLGTDEWDESVKDKFITPMNSNLATKSIPDMYGVTIHANITHMILEQSFINKLSKTKTALINFLLIFLLVTIFNKIYNKINAGYFKIIKVIQLLIFITLFLIVSGVMYSFNLKLELGVGIIGAVLSWDAVKWYNYLYIKKQPFFKDKNH